MAEEVSNFRIEEGNEEEDDKVTENLPPLPHSGRSSRQVDLIHEEPAEESDSSASGRVSFSDLTRALQEGANSSQQTVSSDSDTAAESSSSARTLRDSQLSTSTVSRRSTLKTVHSGRSLSSSESQQQPNESSDKDDTSGTFTLPQVGIPVTIPWLRQSQSKLPSVSPRTTLLASKLSRRATAMRTRFGGGNQTGGSGGGSGGGGLEPVSSAPTIPSPFHRRYKPGDNVLVRNQQSRWSNLVNRHGYPPGEGGTPEEQRGPYMYVLATVKKVHFEEFAAFYTVVRADTGAEQRADADFMEPLKTAKGEAAAMNAATQSSAAGTGDEFGDILMRESKVEENPNTCMARLQQLCFILLLPFLWLFDYLYLVYSRFLRPLWRKCIGFLKRQARLFLNGLEPYVCRMRVTILNFVVICSIWYMFMDQVRLAFIDPSADFAIACVNFAVWLVLVLELIFQVFIRPDGYHKLIISDKASSPTTVRYISAFHLTVETISLGVYVPEFICVLSHHHCSERIPFSFYNAAMMAVTGPGRRELFYGKAYLALVRLRVLGLVRHWRNMWITNKFINMKWRNQGGLLSTFIQSKRGSRSAAERQFLAPEQRALDPGDHKNNDATLTNASTIGTALMVTNSYRALAILWAITGLLPILSAISKATANATALQMTKQLQGTNLIATDSSNETCEFLAASVRSWLLGVTSPDFNQGEDNPYVLSLDLRPYRCTDYFDEGESIPSELCGSLNMELEAELSTLTEQGEQMPESFIWEQEMIHDLCAWWRKPLGDTAEDIANSLDLRSGSIVFFREWDVANLTQATDGENVTAIFSVVTSFDQSYTVATAAFGSFLLQLSLLVCVLGGLSVLRRDAEVLVLGPLRRMLRIVARYAKNPLAQPKISRRYSFKGKRSNRNARDSTASLSSSSSDEDLDNDTGQNDRLALGSYETEQLITAVTRITDLLRKCWGVAGADIISTNLATREGALTEVFNPTVPGKSVYALFGFAAINGFDHALRNLGGDVMILINDVAAVLHGEVFRWGFGDSGQCNKNLGSAFLMVFRIGLVKEVIEKLEQATDVVFSTGTTKTSHSSNAKRRVRQSTASSSGSDGNQSSGFSGIGIRHVVSARNVAGSIHRKVERSASVKAMSLSLQSLPGISTFTDRAVIGMLKSFAGIYRDNKIRNWNNDFRLGAGVGAFTVSMIFGMDAGWAVEGAVGSEYKIDATYLSPHVNMASRMMGACKQYGVSIMLSQAVQELMSDVARSKLRHLDTVTVKGSSVKQRIYTYDARPKGVDFFLYSRSDEQADRDAYQYTPNIWNMDQDLKAMRQHVTDDFLELFNEGRKAYLAGDWPLATKRLEQANEIMVETAFEEGYLEDEIDQLQMQMGEDAQAAAEELKRENGDGPSLYLLSFIKSHGGKAPKNWEGWHPLMRK